MCGPEFDVPKLAYSRHDELSRVIWHKTTKGSAFAMIITMGLELSYQKLGSCREGLSERT
jgi:hypothetical protein